MHIPEEPVKEKDMAVNLFEKQFFAEAMASEASEDLCYLHFIGMKNKSKERLFEAVNKTLEAYKAGQKYIHLAPMLW